MLPDKFILQKDRIPKPFNQNIVDAKGKVLTTVGSCIACTFTKILEVINYVKTGEYIELSKGYMYGRNNYEGKKNSGMDEGYTLGIMLWRGTVPVSMCSDYDEIPYIVEILENRSDIAQLDEEAEKHTIVWWENISGNNSKDRFENVKEYLHKYEMPLAGTLENYKGILYHSVVIVGYEDNNILFHNHTGKSDIEKISYEKLSRVYYLDGGICMDKQLPFNDVKETDWFYPYVKEVYEKGIMYGTKANTFDPNKPLTRAEIATIISRLLEKR